MHENKAVLTLEDFLCSATGLSGENLKMIPIYFVQLVMGEYLCIVCELPFNKDFYDRFLGTTGFARKRPGAVYAGRS